MNRKLITLVLLAISLSLTSSMLFAIDNKPPVANVYSEDKTNITVTPSSKHFTLKLRSNPTTGYSWFLRDYDQKFITPAKHHFKKSEEGLIGAPGYEYWDFVATDLGFKVPIQTLIKMIYARPWQSSDASTQIVFHVSTVNTNQ